MPAHEDEARGEIETGIIEDNEEKSMRLSPDLVDKSLKASLEPLHLQVSALTEMMHRLIQSQSASETTTASSWRTRH